jgi:hypothetical protein
MSAGDLVTAAAVRALVKVDVPESVVREANAPHLYRQCVALLSAVQYENSPHFNEALQSTYEETLSGIVAHITPDPEPTSDGSAGDEVAAAGAIDGAAEPQQRPPPRNTTFNGCKITVLDGPPGPLAVLRAKLEDLREAGQAAKTEAQQQQQQQTGLGRRQSQGLGGVVADATRLRTHPLDSLVLLANTGLHEASDVAALAEVLDLVVHFTVESGTLVVKNPPPAFRPQPGDAVLVLERGGGGGDDDGGGDTAAGDAAAGTVEAVDPETGRYTVKMQDDEEVREGLPLSRLAPPPELQVCGVWQRVATSSHHATMMNAQTPSCILRECVPPSPSLRSLALSLSLSLLSVALPWPASVSHARAHTISGWRLRRRSRTRRLWSWPRWPPSSACSVAWTMSRRACCFRPSARRRRHRRRAQDCVFRV